MTEETGLSLHDALLWKKCAAVSATEFVEAMHFWEPINEKQAFNQLFELVMFGLPLHDKTKASIENNDSGLVDPGLAISTVMGKMFNVPPVEIDGEQPPDFENLQVFRDEAFKVFKMLGVGKVYPWPYPLEMEYFRDIDETDEGRETTENPHGNAERFAVIREKIAWACFAVLAKYPEECRDSNGKVVATKVRECMDKRTSKYWPDGSPTRQPDTIERNIRKALKLVE